MNRGARRKDGIADADRRILYFLLGALLLHLPLLLPSGSWQFGGLGNSIGTPELKVELLPTEDASAETPKAAELEPEAVATAAPPGETPTPSESVSSTEPEESVEESDRNTEELVADSESEQTVASEIGAPAETQMAAAAPEDTELAETRVFEEELVQSGEEGAEEVMEIGEPATAAEPVVLTDAPAQEIAPAQERALTRRLVREARQLLTSGATERVVSFQSRSREFSAVLTRAPAEDGTGIERITADITTDHGGRRASTSLQMKRLSFSHFTQLVDRWDPWVALHDDEIGGRFHSNTEIQVTHDRHTAPRMLGKVTTARGVRVTEEDGWLSMRKMFVGGLETRTERVRLPKMSLPVGLGHDPGGADVHVVRGDTLIVFHADGEYECIDSESQVRKRLTPRKPTYIVGVRDRELRVRGVVNGNVTVYSPERIVVQGNLVYAHGPRPDGQAYLGLVSDGTIEIDRPEVTGPGNLDIHAAVYARQRFVVRETGGRRGATLYIYGSLTAGSISHTEPRYATRTEFDPRFERTRPPGFPETERYEIEDWDGRWRTAEN